MDNDADPPTIPIELVSKLTQDLVALNQHNAAVIIAGYEERAAVLKGNTFGIIDDLTATPEEKVGRLIAQVPLALEIVDEARDTIERLNAENKALRDRIDNDEV